MDDEQGAVLPSRPLAGLRVRPTGGGTPAPAFDDLDHHIGPKDSVMPEKTHAEFHPCTTAERNRSARSNSTGGR